MNLDDNANLLRFIHDRLEDFDFFFARPRDGSQSDLAGKLDSQAGHLSQSAKHAVEPMVGEPQNSFAIQEASQYGAVALLLCNKKLQRR